MSDVWLGRVNRAIEKLFNVKGGPTVVDISPSVVTCVEATNLPVEERYLYAWNRFSQLANVAAVAAVAGAARLRNPAGSNVVIVVEKLHVRTGVNTFSLLNVQQGSATADLSGASSTGFRMDTRGSPNSIGILSIQNASAPPNLSTNIAAVANPTDFILTGDQELTILPGDAIQIADQTVNEQILIHFMWRERVLETSELT